MRWRLEHRSDVCLKKPRNNVPKLETFGSVDVSVRVITFQMRVGHLENCLILF